VKIYIAGPMTGLPQFNIPAFDEAAARLRARGHEVVSPTELDDPQARAASLASADGHFDTLATHGFAYEDFLDRDTEVLRTGGFDAIVLLPGWETSRGANRELGVAIGLGLKRLLLEDVLAPHYSAPFLAAVDGTEGGDVLPGDLAPWSETVAAAGANYGQIVADPSGAIKADGGKPRMDLLPREALIGTAEVLGFGAQKYADHNWRKGFAWSRIYGAALRHLTAWFAGEDLDPESGLSHLDHAACCVMFLQTYVKTSTGTDDRYRPEGDR
jgi:hypothetical protein